MSAVRTSFEVIGDPLTLNRLTGCDEIEAYWYVKLGVHLPTSVLSWRTNLQLHSEPLRELFKDEGKNFKNHFINHQANISTSASARSDIRHTAGSTLEAPLSSDDSLTILKKKC